MSFHTCSCPLHPCSFSFHRFLGSFSYTFRSVHTYSCLSIHIHVCPYIFMSVHTYSCPFIHVLVLCTHVLSLFIEFYDHFHTLLGLSIHIHVCPYIFMSVHTYSCPLHPCSHPFNKLYCLFTNTFISFSYLLMAFHTCSRPLVHVHILFFHVYVLIYVHILS